MNNLEKRTLRISLLLFLMVPVLAIGGVTYRAVERGARDMKLSTYASDSLASRPLIDVQVPNDQATATFAMG
jgi:hypothetical protein